MSSLQSRCGRHAWSLFIAVGLAMGVAACGTSTLYVSGAPSGSVVPRDEMGNPVMTETEVADART